MHNDFEENSVDEYHVARDLLAFRAFQINGQPEMLSGVTYRQELAPGINIAQCPKAPEHEQHHAPQEGCSCGWYAYDENRHWQGGAGVTPHGKPFPNRATGIVRLSGKIIVCERGLKAEHMEILALAVHPLNEVFIRTQFPDVEVFHDEKEMLKQYPLERLPREKEDGMGERAGTSVATGPIRKTLTAGATTVTNLWRRATAQTTLHNVLRWVVRHTLMPVSLAILAYTILSALRVYFPPESMGGFGTLAPFGLMVLLSPLFNVGRSFIGICIYLALLTYGLLGSTSAVDALMGEDSPWAREAAVTLISLYSVPIVLLVGRIMRRFIARPPLTAYAGAPLGAAVRQVGAVRTGRTVHPHVLQSANYLPKKVKSNMPGDGNTTPGHTQEGGQNG